MKPYGDYQFVGIIPARYASSRFPGKPLVPIGGKPMIRRVYEQASLMLGNVYVATDDLRIRESVIQFGGKVVMTADYHQSGTDRCAEALSIIMKEEGRNYDVVINIQGDEPFIKPGQIDLLASCFDDESVEIATLIRKTEPGEDISDPNSPKVIVDISGNAIYFSRAAIPFLRDVDLSQWTYKHTYYKHIGMYAYKAITLKKLTTLPKSLLEKAESLEQNRWLENGFRIRTAVSGWESIGIDTPADLEKAEKMLHLLQ